MFREEDLKAETSVRKSKITSKTKMVSFGSELIKDNDSPNKLNMDKAKSYQVRLDD